MGGEGESREGRGRVGGRRDGKGKEGRRRGGGGKYKGTERGEKGRRQR